MGGSAKTTIIATVTPSASGFEETCSTLKYANTAKSIENKPEVNQRMTKRALLKDYCVEMDRLRQDLVAQRNKDGVFMAKERYDEMMENEVSNAAAVKEAETTLMNKTKELEETMATLGITQEELKATQDELASSQETLTDAVLVLDVRQTSLLNTGTEASKLIGEKEKEKEKKRERGKKRKGKKENKCADN